MRKIVFPAVATAAAVAAVAVAAPGGAASTDHNSIPTWDRHALLDTAEGAHFEIDLGRSVARRAATADVRAAAKKIASDHEVELTELKALAKQLGVTLPRHPSALESHEISQTLSHHGRAVDRSYANLEVGDHVMDIEVADGEQVEGGNAAVKAFAAKYRELYKQHLELCRGLVKKVGA